MSPRREILSVLVLFGTLYFVQGLVEPSAGVLGQPIQTDLSLWELSAGRIGEFMGFIAIPWSLKPLFGLLSDFVPLASTRRRSYLIVSTLAATAIFGWLALEWRESASLPRIGWLLLAVTAAVAMTDVVIDGLAVEVGQPRQMTGQLQAVQWGAMSVATILAGSLGGMVAGAGQLRPAFWACAALSLVGWIVVAMVVREPPRTVEPAEALRAAWRQLQQGRRWAILLAVAAFLFLWSFNPFSSTVQQLYMTQELGLSQQFYGHLYSLQAVAQVVACVAYWWYCRKVRFSLLVHVCIALGVAGNLFYLGVSGPGSAVAASILVGLAYQTATLVQLDLAARICPPAAAAFVFALLMAASNTGISAGSYLGGHWYDALAGETLLGSRHQAFDAVVLIGAAFTAGCWLLVPVLKSTEPSESI